jgi:hypothetical protein
VLALIFAADELAAAAKKGEIKVVLVYALPAAVQVFAILTPVLLLSVAPAIICKGVNTLVTIDYPAKTVGLPCAIKVQPATGSPTLANGRLFTNIVLLPWAIGGA